MAVDFGDNNNSAYYSAASPSGLGFPNDEFFLVFWTRIDDTSGSVFQYPISTGGYLGSNTFNVIIQEDDFGDAADGKLSIALHDGTNSFQTFGTTIVADGEDRMWVFQRTSSNWELWSCVRGSGDATLEFQQSASGYGSVSCSAWQMGRRTDGSSTRYYEEHLGEVALVKGESLSEADIEGMANGTQTVLELSYSPEAYWPLTDSDDTDDASSGGSHDLTESGTVGDSGFQFIVAASGAVALTDLTNHRIYQRVSGAANIALAGTYTGTVPTDIQARVLLASDGTTEAKTWTTLTSATIASGNWSGTLPSVPEGGMYIVEVRSRDSGGTPIDSATGSNEWGVGVLVLVAGSSSAERWEEQGTGTPDDTSKVYHDSAWKAASGTGGVAFANALGTALSVPVATINAGVSGDEWTDWDGDADGSYSAAESTVTAVGGNVEAVVVVGLGSNDAANGNVDDDDYYADEARLFIALIRSHVGNSSLPIFLNAPNRRTSVADVQAQRVKVGWFTVIGDTDVHGVAQTFDLDLDDGVHLTSAGYAIQGERSAVAVNDIIGSGTYHRGPSIVSVSAVDATHTDVGLSHNGGSDFTPTSSITGFAISDDNWSSELSISAAARQNSTTIRLTHASASGQRRVRYQYGANPTVTGAVIDNSTAATGGLPLAYLADDVAEAAGGSLPVLAQHYRRMKAA